MSVDFCLMGNYRGIRDSLGFIKPLYHKYPAKKEEIGGALLFDHIPLPRYQGICFGGGGEGGGEGPWSIRFFQ